METRTETRRRRICTSTSAANLYKAACWRCARRLYPFWQHLTEALRTGRPQNEARDGSLSLFAALYAEPARLKEFLHAMTGLSRGANMTIARQFPWSTYRSFADVGT